MNTINISEQDIENLKREISELKKRISENEAILQFIETKRSLPMPPVFSSVHVMETKNVEMIDLSKLNIPEAGKRSITDDIWDIVSKFGDQEFIVAAVEAIMRQKGKPIEAKNPRAAIAGALARLVKAGKVEIAFEGSGNIPHRFKLVKKQGNIQEQAVNVPYFEDEN